MAGVSAALDSDRCSAVDAVRPRVRGGGLVGEGPLPTELTSLRAWVACIPDARPLEEEATLLERSRLTVEQTERHDDVLATPLERVHARLRVARFLSPEGGRRGIEFVDAARAAHEAGLLGYGSIIARR